MNSRKINLVFGTDLIKIKKSKIRNAGLGTFAKKNIKKGIFLGEYVGEELDYNTVYNLYNKKYLFKIIMKNKPSYYINATEKHGNWTRYINGVKTKHQQKKQNVKYYQFNERIYIKTIMDIKKEDELLANYGKTYWEKN